MNQRITLALIGAGGKMGCRVTDHLRHRPDYTLLCVENGERGLACLKDRGLAPLPRDEALARADVVILALNQEPFSIWQLWKEPSLSPSFSISPEIDGVADHDSISFLR